MTETKNTQTTNTSISDEILTSLAEKYGYRFAILAKEFHHTIDSDDPDVIAHHCGNIWLRYIIDKHIPRHTLLNKVKNIKTFTELFGPQTKDIVKKDHLKNIADHLASEHKLFNNVLSNAVSLLVGNYMEENNHACDHFDQVRFFVSGREKTELLSHDITLGNAFAYFAYVEFLEQENKRGKTKNRSDNNDKKDRDSMNSNDDDHNDQCGNDYSQQLEEIIDQNKNKLDAISSVVNRYENDNNKISRNDVNTNITNKVFGFGKLGGDQPSLGGYIKIPITYNKKYADVLGRVLYHVFENVFIEVNDLPIRSLFELESLKHTWVPDRLYSSLFDENDIIVETEREVIEFSTIDVIIVLDISGSVTTFLPTFGTLYKSLPSWITKHCVAFDTDPHTKPIINQDKIFFKSGFGGTSFRAMRDALMRKKSELTRCGKTVKGGIVITDCYFNDHCGRSETINAFKNVKQQFDEELVVLVIDNEEFNNKLSRKLKNNIDGVTYISIDYLEDIVKKSQC